MLLMKFPLARWALASLSACYAELLLQGFRHVQLFDSVDIEPLRAAEYVGKESSWRFGD